MLESVRASASRIIAMSLFLLKIAPGQINMNKRNAKRSELSLATFQTIEVRSGNAKGYFLSFITSLVIIVYQGKHRST